MLFLFQSILKEDSSVEVTKRQGLSVLRARVTTNSCLVGRKAVEAKFCENYKAAIVAVQQGGKNVVKPLSSLTFGAGGMMVLQANVDCLLLSPPMTRGSFSRKSFGAFGSSLANLTNLSRAHSMERLDAEVSE